MDIYQALLRPVLFSGLKSDPEWLHQQSLNLLSWCDRPTPNTLVRWLEHTYCHTDSRLQQTLWNLPFTNPIGLAAGFDKDGIASGIWSSLGFGFAELGTVTFHPQPGNPQPRLFRLPEDSAALNRMGFNNQGAAILAARLQERWRRPHNEARSAREKREKGRKGGKIHNSQFTIQNSPIPNSPIPLGINLGKSKITPLEEAAADYLASFQLLKTLGDYFVVNVSSPNTPGLRSLQSAEQLRPILQALQQENIEQKPILVKIAPDLAWDDIASVIELAQEYQLAGMIATNTTIRRDGLKTQKIAATGNLVTAESGGISGAPVRARSTEVIRFIYKETQGQLPIIGVGGVFSAADAWEKITAGASLVQVYTGWIYEGPWMVRRILAGLGQHLTDQGFASIQEAVGTGVQI
jgi:dihydroorotate dehydrogenase